MHLGDIIRATATTLAVSLGCSPGAATSGDSSTTQVETSTGQSTSTGPGDPGSTDTSTTATPTTGTASTGAATGDVTTSDVTTSAVTTGDPSTGEASTGEPIPDLLGGPCAAGWELPATSTASLKIHVPDAAVTASFDPDVVYPDDTPAACVLWDGELFAGVRIAFGPVVGDGPESLLHVAVGDGERSYGTNEWPPPAGAYDGVSVRYTFRESPDIARTFDLAADKGAGQVTALWVPHATGEHIMLDAKLSMPGDDTGAQLGFTIDAVIAPLAAPTVEFCGSLDSHFKCDLAGCAGWVNALAVADPALCDFTGAGFCAAEVIVGDDDAYDSAFFTVLDGTTRIVRVGGEGCSFSGTDHPAGWNECVGGPGDAPECACVCTGGTCPGDTALALLEACGLPQPCPNIDSGGDDWGPGESCVFQAAAAGMPGVLRVHTNQGDPDFDDRVYLRGDGTAMWLEGECDVSCIGSCSDRDWGVARSCTLKKPAFFLNCDKTLDPDILAECHDFANWFTGCVVSPATCP